MPGGLVTWPGKPFRLMLWSCCTKKRFKTGQNIAAHIQYINISIHIYINIYIQYIHTHTVYTHKHLGTGWSNSQKQYEHININILILVPPAQLLHSCSLEVTCGRISSASCVLTSPRRPRWSPYGRRPLPTVRQGRTAADRPGEDGPGQSVMWPPGRSKMMSQKYGVARF